MTDFPDRVNALAEFLKADTDVSSIVGERVFVDEIPDATVSRMPRPCVLLRSGGGAQTIRRGNTSNARVDVRCYGWKPSTARELHNAVYSALDHLQRKVFLGCLLHSAIAEAQPIPMREAPIAEPGTMTDPSKHWPLMLSQWQILAADIEAVSV